MERQQPGESGWVTLFGRRITLDTIYRSAAIAVTSSLVAFGALAVLLGRDRSSRVLHPEARIMVG